MRPIHLNEASALTINKLISIIRWLQLRKEYSTSYPTYKHDNISIILYRD